MFTLQCTTCNAKLAVKNDNLIGQIVACPKCGSMVLIQPPEESLPILNPFSDSSEEQEVPRPAVRFPDAMTSRSPADAFRRDFDETENESEKLEVVPESELRTRKILLGILAGFVIILLSAVLLRVLLIYSPDLHKQSVQVLQKEPLPVNNDTPSAAENSDKKSASLLNDSDENIRTQNDEQSEDIKGTLSPLTERTAEKEPVPVQTVPVAPQKGNNENTEKDKLAELLAKPLIEEPKKDDVVSGIRKKMPNLLKESAELTLDISNILNIPLKKWILNKTPLLNVLRQFSELTEIPLTLDIDELLCRSISADTPITITCENETAGDFLKQILMPLGLTFFVEENQITVSVPESERNKIIEQSFDVSDIAEVLPLKDIIGYVGQLFTFPENTSVSIDGNKITVHHTKKNVEQINRMLEQLRVLREMKQKTESPPEKLVPESFGWDAVCVPMTLNYYQPEPLADVLRQIERTAKVRILVDSRTLHRLLVSPKTLTASIHCNREPVDTALQRLLSSVDGAELNYRIVSADIIEVSAADELSKPEKTSIEIHRFETEEKKLSETPEELVRTLKTAVAMESWASAENPNGGAIVIDKPTGCLFVRQSQSVQRELRLMLERKD